MSAKHTPSGPEWAAQDVGHGIRIGDIAWVGFGSSYPKKTHRANAQLIAAAPDLLEALDELLGCISETRGSDATKAVLSAQSALTTARANFPTP
jgi:hypothetical protein